MTPGKIVALSAVLLLSGSFALAAEKLVNQDKGKKGAPALLTHSITVKPGEYVSLHDGKAYGAGEAAAHKAELDFVYLVGNDGGTVKKEFYNLSGKDTKLPDEVLGTRAGIVALTWDDELVAKCKTVADLKRMTGSYTANSFSFYGTAANNAQGELENKRFIFLDSKERMGFFTIKAREGDALALEVRITP
jgi:hypothetical protein